MPESPIAPAHRGRGPGWLNRAGGLLQKFVGHPDRYSEWRRYKPLHTETIDRWQLGVGTLPASPCTHRRLIYPVFEDRRIVGIRGRVAVTLDGSPVCDDQSWLSAGGSKASLWGWDLLQPRAARGKAITITENPVDAMLAMQVEPNQLAVGVVAGSGTWRSEWSERIAAAEPENVLVWFDNDLAGAPNAETYSEQIAEWRAKHPNHPNEPTPMGPRIVQQLRELASKYGGFGVDHHDWAPGTPRHHDLGQHLAEQLDRVKRSFQ